MRDFQLKFLYQDPHCEDVTCHDVTLENNECARLYKEILCHECYEESITMERVENTSDGHTNTKYSTYSTTGNFIQSTVVNVGCEIWIHLKTDDLSDSVPIQALKAGKYHTMTNIDVRT